MQDDPVSSELVFFGYALRYGEARRDAGGFAIARLPAQRPPANAPGTVVYAACNGTYAVPFADIDRAVKNGGVGLGAGGDPAALLAGAEFAVVDSRCRGNITAQLSSFMEAPRWGELALGAAELDASLSPHSSANYRRGGFLKAFVTGGAGFIGSNLVDRLLARGDEVVAYDNLSTGRREFLRDASSNPRFALVEGESSTAPR